MTGHGGWPMTVFLTPEGKPFYGGTYYPPTPRSTCQLPAGAGGGGRRVREARRVMAAAGRLTEALDGSSRLGAAEGEPDEEVLRAAVRRMGSVFDEEWAGFGGAPKFPPASAIEFLLRPITASATPTRCGWRPRPSTRWPWAECTTFWAAGLPATRSTASGWCRTSRRCCTTTPCWPPPTCTLGGHRRAAAPPGGRGDARLPAAEMLLPEGVFASAQDADTDGHRGPDLRVDTRSAPRRAPCGGRRGGDRLLRRHRRR